MIENLRKYTGLIIVLFVLVIVGFLFMDTSSIRASQGGAPVLKISGRNYTDSEVRSLGSSSYDVTQSLAQGGDYQLYSFLFSLSGDAQSQDQAVENFFINRVLIRSAKEEFGIYPGDEEIDSFIRKLRVFSGPDGAFSQESYRNFIEKGIGRLGLNEADIRELASDIIAQQKLAKILGSGLKTDRDVIAKQAKIDGQRIKVEIARIDIAPIKEKITPTEDEIKTYWETVQDAFKTQEKRKFTYLIAKPAAIEEPEALAPLAEKATDEAKAEYEKKKAERDAKIAEAKRKSKFANDKKVEDLYDAILAAKSVNLEQLAKEFELELKITESFTRDAAPDELKSPLRSSSSQDTAIDELFKINITSDHLSSISPPIAIGENEWLIARLDEVKESSVQTYEEAREAALARLISDKASASLTEASKAAAEKIKASITEGKTFAEATKAAGITHEIVTLPEVNQSFSPDPLTAPANLFPATKYTSPGELAEPVIETDRAFIIHVVSREIVKDAEAEQMIDSAVARATDTNEINAFTSWLNEKSEAANVERLGRR